MATPAQKLASRGLTFGAMCKLANMTARQVDYAVRTGVIRASVVAAAGKGTGRVFGFQDAVALRVVARLREAGISLPKIRKDVRTIRKHWPQIEEPLATMTFITDGADVFTVVPEREAGGVLMSTALAPGQLAARAIVIRVSAIAAEVREALRIERQAAKPKRRRRAAGAR